MRNENKDPLTEIIAQNKSERTEALWAMVRLLNAEVHELSTRVTLGELTGTDDILLFISNLHGNLMIKARAMAINDKAIIKAQALIIGLEDK